MKNETKIGIMFLLFMGVMVWLTVTMRGCPLTKKTELRIGFRSLEGLKRGDDIIYRGVPIGKVGDVRLTIDGGIATCELEAAQIYQNGVVVIPEEVEAYVEDTTVLGGKRIVMLPLPLPLGTPHTPLPIENPAFVLDGKVREPITRTASLIAERIANLLEEGGPIANVAKQLEQAADDVARIAGKIRAGEGTIGRLLNDERLYERATEMVGNVAAITKDIRDGRGLIGRLIQDENIADRFDRVTEAIDKQTGTVGKLIHDGRLYDNAASITERIDRILARLEDDEGGTIGRLFNDDALYNYATDTLDQARQILGDAREGRGNLGRFLNDERLFENILDISESVKSISAKLNTTESTLGMLINDKKLIDKAQEGVEGLTDIVGAFNRFRTFAGFGYQWHEKQDMSVTRLYLRVEPSADKFFYGGVAILGFSKDGDIAFDGQFDGDRSDDTKLVPEAAIGWRFFDRALTFRFGFLEGQIGGGFDLDVTIPGLEEVPMRFTVEGRLPYNDKDFDDSDINEDVRPFMLRVNFSVLLIDRLRLYVGANNLFDRVGFSWGLSFEYRDEDLRSMVGFLALGS